MKLPRLGFPLGMAAALLAGSLTLQAGTAGVHDNAGFFSATAKADAGWNIGEVQKTLKKDVCVETFNEIPADLRQGMNLQDRAVVNRVCEQWSLKRAREQSVNGVYMLLVRDPAHLQVVVGNETQKQAFTFADRTALVNMMLAKLRTKDYDAALREGVSFVASTMRNHMTSHARPQSVPATGYRSTAAQPESSGGWLVPLLVVGVIVWVVMAIIRTFFRGGMSAGGGMPMTPGSAGGGGFFRNMLGGMFGAAAGMWLYDQFSGSHGSSAYGASPDDRSNGGGDSGFSGQDTDYSSSGGSFGDDSGGGFGGGDSGGGGGFDGGGGGGDSGGGGGDF